MKPQERAFLRESNKSPFIKYPIHETVSTTAHKISLMIQFQLGGMEQPTDKDFIAIRRQFLIDKCIIFDRIHRLIRCIIDCKAFDCDAISTRHALDLARSFVAEFWENSNLQLRQIPQIGPAAVRKLVSNDINTIEKLMEKDASTIERIMSKNPPYGRKTKDLLIGFPNLDLIPEIIGKLPSKAGQNPRVNVKVVLFYKNEKVPVWKNKKPSLTFTAETTDGKLVHFWRGNIVKLEKGLEVKFTAELSGPEEEIKCWLACEEIVGTTRSCILKHGLPPSAFPALVPRPKMVTKGVTAEKKASNDKTDEFGGDDFEDDDLLAVVKSIEPAEYDYGSDEFEDIDNFGDSKPTNPKKGQKQEGFVPSIQMANGKWTCSHPCADGKLLKNGKLCKHRCCHEGLDKPRKMKKTSDAAVGSGLASQSMDTNSKVKDVNPGGSQKTKVRMHFCHSLHPNTRQKMKSASEIMFKLKEDALSDAGDAELVDLAQDSDPVTYAHLAPRDYRKLHSLHTRIQSDKAVRLPKKKPQFSYASGRAPDLPFLQKSNDTANTFDFAESGDDDFPSPSALAPQSSHGRLIPDPLESPNFREENAAPLSYWGSSASFEAGMRQLAEAEMIDAPSPKDDSSFANGVFDFDVFNGNFGAPQNPVSSPLAKEILKNEPTSTPIMKDSLKRARSATLELQQAKHRRIMTQESTAYSTQATVPDWVNEFDSGLINELKGFVDFVD